MGGSNRKNNEQARKREEGFHDTCTEARGMFKIIRKERLKSMTHMVRMSTKERVQEDLNNILGTWCQNSNSRKGEEEGV